MALEKELKTTVISSYRTADKDTGSPEVQVALLTTRINQLASHFDKNPRDHHSRRGLLKMIGQRKRQLNYLKNKDFDRYKTLITKLGIRG